MINRLIHGVLIASCVVGSGHAAEQARQPMPAAEVAKIKADVTAAAHEYMAKFSRSDSKGIAEQVYSHPSIALRAGKVEVVDPDAIADQYANNIKGLKAGGWVKSVFINPKVCVLTSDTALMSTKYARYDKDNKVILEGGETDVFIRTPQGWRLVALLGHRAEGGINCKE